MKSLHLRTTVGLTLAMTAFVSHASDFVVNGSFEAAGPNLSAGFCYLNFAPYQCGSIPGWGGNQLPLISATSSSWGNPSGLSGWNVADGNVLAGIQNAPGAGVASVLTQLIALPGAGAYTLSWQDAGRPSSGSEQYNVAYGGTALGSFTTLSGQGWTSHSITFNAAGSGVLSFTGVALGSDGTSFIDTVSLISAVPEAKTTSLLLAGLLAMGYVVRRKRTG